MFPHLIIRISPPNFRNIFIALSRLMHNHKSNAYQFQLTNSQHINPAVRYQGFTKLYQLNISKMFLRCPDSPFLKKEQPPKDCSQMLVVNATCTEKASGRAALFRNSKQSTFKKITFLNQKPCHPTAEKRNESTKKRNEIKKKIYDRLKFEEDIRSNQLQREREFTSTSFHPAIPETEQCGEMTVSDHALGGRKTIDYPHESHKIESRQTKNSETSSPTKLASVKKYSLLQPPKKRASQLSRKTILPQIRHKSEKIVHKCKESMVDANSKKNALLVRDPEELKKIKSQSYAILEYPSRNLILNYRGTNPFEIASLTKIMTFYCVRRLEKTFTLNIETQSVVITDRSMETGGTSAEILSGQVYTVEQLLYGLMLPSGNDAAVALAIWGGKLLLRDLAEDEDRKINSKEYQKAFVKEMNTVAKQLGLSQSRFGNPHGLPCSEARSSAFDVAFLTAQCLTDGFFCQVVRTKCYRCSIKNEKLGTKRSIQWMNTNKLLRRDGFIGVKTGITVTAGPCLASAYQFRDKIYIAVILRSNKVSRRFKETRKLLSWSLNKLYKDELTAEESKKLQGLSRNKPEVDSDYSEDQREFLYERSDESELKKRISIINDEM